MKDLHDIEELVNAWTLEMDRLRAVEQECLAMKEAVQNSKEFVLWLASRRDDENQIHQKAAAALPELIEAVKSLLPFLIAEINDLPLSGYRDEALRKLANLRHILKRMGVQNDPE